MTEIKKGIAIKSADTSIIENRLRNTAVGDTVTYEELSKMLGRDVRQFCSGNIQTALKTMRDESIFFDCVRGEGYVRLDNEQATTAAGRYAVRAKKAARTGMKHLAKVPFETLSNEGKMKHLTTSAQLGAIELFSSSKSAKKIENQVKTTSTKMAIGETLKLFGG